MVEPTGLVFDKGSRPLGFGVFTAGKQQVNDARVALYFAHGANGHAFGPYPARIESLATKPAFVAQTTGQDSKAARVVYVVDNAPLRRDGEWRVLALIRSGGAIRKTYAAELHSRPFPAPAARVSQESCKSARRWRIDPR